MAPLRIGLVGAGIFAQEAHVPALQALGDTFEIAAIHSRTRAKAEALAAQIAENSPAPEVVDDLDTLLGRADIEAVDLVLPIPTMPDVIRRALAAGKHVISEKPAAPDVKTGRELLAVYAQRPDQVWSVAENWRYEDAILHAADLIRAGEIGQPVTCHWVLHTSMNQENKYYHTTWRRESAFPGGFILDGGVHHVAALRLILGEISAVNAVARQIREDLPPIDTLNAALVFESGLAGMYSITYAAESPWPNMLHIVGENGTLRVHPGEIEITAPSGATRTDRTDRRGIENELAAFAAAIQDGQPLRNTPEEGVRDVAVIEAMLRSAETGQQETVERV
jgi:predicted dehydrogenase